MSWRGREVPQVVVDCLVAAAVLGLGLVELLRAPAGTSLWGQAGLTVLWSGLLPLRRRMPVPVLAVVVLLGPAQGLVNDQGASRHT